MLQFAIYGKTLSPDDVPYIRDLIGKLESGGAGIFIYEPFLQVIRDQVTLSPDFRVFYHADDIRGQADVLLSIGGDGTLLDTIMLVRDSGIPVLGLNMGRLGFLASFSREELMQGIDRILRQEYSIEKRALLRLESDKPYFGELNFALNEFTVSKKGALPMITVHVWVDGKFLHSYWGDGLIVSTMTGSTAYSLSCGGPIITPGSPVFVITPVATHNLTVRPVVIPDHSTIRIRVEGRQMQCIVSLDSRSVPVDGNVEFLISRASFDIHFLTLEGQDFFRTIRSKLNWGIDIRN